MQDVKDAHSRERAYGFNLVKNFRSAPKARTAMGAYYQGGIVGAARHANRQRKEDDPFEEDELLERAWLRQVQRRRGKYGSVGTRAVSSASRNTARAPEYIRRARGYLDTKYGRPGGRGVVRVPTASNPNPRGPIDRSMPQGSRYRKMPTATNPYPYGRR